MSIRVMLRHTAVEWNYRAGGVGLGGSHVLASFLA